MSAADERVGRWVRPEIRGLSAYHVADAAGLIKLDAMENPYPWPAPMRAAWLQRLAGVEPNRYPDAQARALKARLARTFDVPSGAGLLLGNGSDEIIQMLALAVGGRERRLLTPEPGFTMFRLIAAVAGMDYHGVALNADDFGLDVDATLAAIRTHAPALIFIAHPNNPTGNLFEPDAILRIVEAAPGLVVVDEAYAPFATHTCLPWVGEYDNLLVMRTLSKMGLAGLRLGFLAGPAAWLDELDKLRLPYNINALTQASAEFALSWHAELEAQAERIRAERARLAERLAGVPGVRVFPSQANFLLFRVAAGCADSAFAALVAAGVLIKNVSGAHPLLADCLRVTVGTPRENDAFIEALEGA